MREETTRLLMIIIKRLQAQEPCRERSIAITKLEEALMWIEKSTEDEK